MDPSRKCITPFAPMKIYCYSPLKNRPRSTNPDERFPTWRWGHLEGRKMFQRAGKITKQHKKVVF